MNRTLVYLLGMIVVVVLVGAVLLGTGVISLPLAQTSSPAIVGQVPSGSNQPQTTQGGGANVQQPAQSGGQASSPTDAQGGGLAGQVESIEGDTVIIVTDDGEKVRVETTETTLIEKYISVPVTDLEPEEQVIIEGSTDDDGNMTATSIQAIPQGRFAADQQQGGQTRPGGGQFRPGGGQGRPSDGQLPGGQIPEEVQQRLAQLVQEGGLGGFRGGGFFGGQGGRLVGQVESVEGDVLVVVNQNGEQVNVQTTDETVIQKYASVTAAELEPGERVTVSGSENEDGSITARSVQVAAQNLFDGQGGFVVGQVESVEGDVLIVVDQNGEQTRVETDETTTIGKSVSISVDDLGQGERVAVFGTENEDAILTAFMVQVSSQELTDEQGGGLAGQVESVEDNVLIVVDEDGEQVRVETTEETVIQRNTSLSLADLEPGEQVIIVGIENEDGSILAESVQVGFAGRFRGAPGGSR